MIITRNLETICDMKSLSPLHLQTWPHLPSLLLTSVAPVQCPHMRAEECSVTRGDHYLRVSERGELSTLAHLGHYAGHTLPWSVHCSSFTRTGSLYIPGHGDNLLESQTPKDLEINLDSRSYKELYYQYAFTRMNTINRSALRSLFS